ncbi:hypothetical protein GCM10025783_30480 [Amnibacterium soli]|uniref:Uncharacterized protein n=1 Tax=Amnibacterium soli TaxID=1282736 RepID=A0ABP8ZFY0_9MICO
MSTRNVITAADPARALPREALELDVDGLLKEFTTQPEIEHQLAQTVPRSTPPRRRRLDLALAAVIAAFLAAIAFLPASFTHGAIAGRSTSTPTSAPTSAPTSTPTASSADARATATALLNEITVPTAANRVSTPPTQYLAQPRTGLSCKGQASASPRYWIVPDTTLQAVATFLKTHRPASATRLPFNHNTDSGISSAFTSYRPAPHSLVVIALATTPEGIGIRADADVFLGNTCINSGTTATP